MPVDPFKNIVPLTEKHLKNAIGEVTSRRKKTFDSHKVIETIMRQVPSKYVQALCNYQYKPNPIRLFHANIGRAIKRIEGVESTGRTRSRNVKGAKTGNETWHITDSYCALRGGDA